MARGLFVGLVLAELLALGLAVLLSRRRSDSPLRRALPLLIAFALANDLTTEALHAWAFPGAPRPFRGGVRVGYHLETALVLGWPAALAAASWAAFQPALRARRAALAIGVTWTVLVGAMAALHPLDLPGSGAPRTRFFLHAGELAGLAGAGAAIVRGWGRAWSRDAVAVGLLCAVELAVALLGPWAHDVFTSWTELARVPYLLGFIALSAVLLRWAIPPRP